MIALIIVGSIIAYVAIGLLSAFILVWLDMINPYYDDNAIIATVLAWPLMLTCGTAFYGLEKFIEYLQDFHDRREK
jgi:hypothetical protein